ncbi:restriction endonuclease subunit S [Faecalicoccus pleomorphus]|uniref:restriction endonuclease subunit S n=1 Tax=Faecalicoccus pleomorphus TaxID=1323 RepID=UPI0022E39B67|nr:restriction endonuclease subunit S [Faecalicoccus pleomorphus]
MRMTQLKTIADIQTGPFGSQLHKEDYVETGTPIVTVEHLGNRVFTEQNLPRVSDSDKARLIKYTLSTGDIVFSRVGSVDRCSYVDKSHDGWMFSGRCLRVRPTEPVDSLYLYYYFCLEETKQFVRNIAVGATMPSINTKLLGEVEIALPDLNNQKRIAAVLSSLDDKIENNQKLNDNLEQQASALFSSFYDRSNTEVRYTDLIQILGGGTPKTGENTYWNGNIAFFTPKDVGTPYTLITEKTITEEGLSHCNSRLYPVNTVFVTARGTVGKVGMSGVPMAMNQSCYALVGKETHQLLVYFYTLKAVDRLKHKASGAVFDAITTRDFESEQIMKLSDDDAKAFLCIAEPMFQKVLNNCIENLRLSTLRDSLLPKLMSGEVDVSAVKL